MGFLRLFITNFLVTASLFCYAQQNDSTVTNVENIPDKYYSKVDNKLSWVDKKLTKKSLKYLLKFEKQERKLQQKLQATNLTPSANLFADTKEKYNQLTSQLKSKTDKVGKITGGQYNSYLDTLGTSLSFLKQFKGIGDKAKTPLNSLHQLQGKLKQSEQIKQYITERKQQIKEVLSTYTKLPASLTKEFTKLSKTAYYYSAQVNEYKAMLKDPVKAERKAISLLNKVSAFQKFMQKHSQLASLFPLPDNNATSPSLTGLQTRASVQALMQQQVVPTGGSNTQQIIQQNIAQAQGELGKLKDKVNKLGGRGGDVDMPDFKPNTQKTKSFLKRLEYGANIQFEKSNKVFPSSSNIGLSLGYKVNDKGIIGVGFSYKMGIGTFRHIVVSHQGIGLRSFVDYKIKKSLFISGGYEMNYNTAFKKIEQLKNFNDWQNSGLIGLSKKYSVSKKVKGEIKVLYDLLANKHKPVTQPIIFRVGYNL